MKIGIISTEYLPATGGAQTYLENLIAVLERVGHSVTVYQFNNGEVSPKVKLLPHKPKIIPGGRAADLWWYSVVLLTQIYNLVKEDVLIVNYAFHSLPVFWHKRVIVLSHGCEWDIPPTSWSQKLKILIAKWSFKHFKYLVANDSNYLRQMGIRIKPKERMYQEILPGKWFLPNAIDPNVFKPTNPNREIQKLNTILVPRNVSPARGVHLAIESFAIFRKKFPETNLVVTGHLDFAPADYRNKIFELLKKLKLRNSVKFMGNINWKSMPGVYSASQLSIIPTIQREGTSLAALESMASGVATVSTNRWGLADLPTEQADANPEKLAELMIRIYPERKEISIKQRKIVLEKYNLGLWGRTWLKVISQISQ